MRGVASREILADALDDYQGTFCMVTHDRTLIRHVADKIIEIDSGEAKVFQGNYDSYLQWKERQLEKVPASTNGVSTDSVVPGNGRRGRRPPRVLTPDQEQLRMLGRRSRQLSARMEEIVAAITEHESITAELEAMFAEPWRL